MKNNVDNSQDILDGRDVIKRAEELRDERDSLQSDMDEAQESLELHEPVDGADDVAGPELQEALDAATEALKEWDEENGVELKALEDFIDEGSRDWRHGCTLINESYFETYSQQYAEDIGAMDKSTSWLANCIDWKQAASELKQDYTGADFDGVTYYYRS